MPSVRWRSAGLTKPLCAFIAAALLAACSPTGDRAVLRSLKTQLTAQYHACVPLGWTPVPVAGTYYPGVSVTLTEEGVWLPARWIGRVRTRDLARADVRAAFGVLNELTADGLLDRDDHVPGVWRYSLTAAGQRFYYDGSAYGNNPEHIPYLCYSTIVPQRVASISPIDLEPARDGKRDVDSFIAAFEWTPSPAPAWANSAFIRTHSVTLGPIENPAVAQFQNIHGNWTITQLSGTESPAARVVDSGAWPRPRL
jgi:hypothetical protein